MHLQKKEEKRPQCNLLAGARLFFLSRNNVMLLRVHLPINRCWSHLGRKMERRCGGGAAAQVGPSEPHISISKRASSLEITT